MMHGVAQLLCILFVVGKGYTQMNLAQYGTASQSSTYYNNRYTHSADLAIKGGPTHNWYTYSCSATGGGRTVAWWMLTFPSDTFFSSRVVIYYRSDTPYRLAGYSLYITNDTISSNAVNPPSNGLCYHHNGTELPNLLQNITCDQMGRHVIIYNERKNGVTYPDGFSDIALLEFCDVQIIGCYKTWWGGGCSKPCPTYCTDHHCYPDNGTCVWGCNSANCIDGECNNDGICAKGCIKGKGGLLCDESNVASGSTTVISAPPDQNIFLVTDGDKGATSCMTLSGADSWLQIDTGGLQAIKSINVVIKEGLSVPDYAVFVTNASGDRSEALNFTDNTVVYTYPYLVHEHKLNPLIIGRYLIVSKTTSQFSVDICELEIIGCPVGRYGDLCDEVCPENCYGTCHLVTGTCLFGCEDGFIGVNCDESCTPPQFGRQCSETCHCMNSPYACNHVNGTCPLGGCREGWQGHSCSEECGLGTFGKNCEQTCNGCLYTECLSTTGKCEDTSGCRPGWKNGNSMCNIACDDGYFGDCSSQCYCRDGLCNKSTGACPNNECDRGWMGNTCSEECVLGTFGYNCVETCNGCANRTCDKYEGNCTHGCEDGYTGYQCKILVDPEKSQSEVSKSPAGAIGGVIGGTLVVAMIVIGVVFLKRRRSNESKKSDKYKKASTGSNEDRSRLTSKENTLLNAEGAQYVNVATVAPNKRKTLQTEDKDKAPSRTNPVYINHEEETANLGDIYCNIVPTKYSVKDLKTIIQDKKDQNSFQTDFESLPKGLNQPHEEALKEQNKNKNRYLTTWPYDHSRVILQGNDTPDYINASYIESYEKKKAYIATQGPRKNTVVDFWHMVCQENVEVIVMVTLLEENGKKKCYQYWPESLAEPINVGQYKVRLVEEKENVLYVYRKITLNCKEDRKGRTVHHYQYLQWEDHGVPDTIKLVNFYRTVKRAKMSLEGPMIVHCSAGIGRTGTFLAIDALYEHGVKTGFIDVLEYVQMMRKDRMNMIQTQDQYATVYEALLEAFTVPDTCVDKEDFCNCFDKDNSDEIPKNQQKMSVEFKKLQDLKPCYTQDDYRAAISDDNISKNVNKQILPHDRYRPYLMSYGKSRNDYINAVIVPSLILRKNIFVTQCPLKSTVVDFWTLIFDTECSTIVCLESETTDFLPEEDTSLSFENIEVSLEKSKSPFINIRIEHKEAERSKHVKVRLAEDWVSTDLIPKSEDFLLDIIASVSDKNDSDSLAVVCRDGCTRSGMFVALYLTIQKLDLESKVDLFHVVRMMQIRRPEFILNQEEYEFCYKCIIKYTEKESLYANV